GMSGIARVMLEMGYNVSGSDLVPSGLTKSLESIGATIFEGHRPSNLLRDTELLVYSSSVSKENPELVEARKRRIRIAHRAEMLGEIFNAKLGIAVTGTHGKTTTTSLVSVMLEGAGLDPTVIIGGEVEKFKGNAKLGGGAYAAVEADESDSSFLSLKPFYAVITNVEMEHLDHFKDLGHIKKSYRAFIGNTKNGGIVFYNHDDPNCREILKDYKGKAMSFGSFKGTDIYPIDIEMDRFNTSFKCIYKNKLLGKVELRIPGVHNVLNALAAILVGLNAGLKFEEITKAIRNFGGAKRRFQLRADVFGVMLIDDYAHHPTEIKAVLDACRNWKNKRLVVIFQPHRYTRTKILADEFGRCFNGVDKLILTEIYAANEKPIRGVSIKNIYDKAKTSGISDVTIVKKDRIADHIMDLKKRGDMIVVLGAGDIKKVADDICDSMKKERLLKDALIEGLKRSVDGLVLTEESLKSHTSFRIGGPAAIWVEPRDCEDLKTVLAFAKKSKIPLFVIGNGSNVLAKDEGFKGMVVHLGSPYFKRITLKGPRVMAGAGSSLPGLVRLCCDKGLGGIESLVGIPGTVGGAVCMNAGGWSNPIFKNIGDVVESLKVMDYNGNVKRLKKEKIVFGYRSSNLDAYIILEVFLKLDKSNREDLVASCSRFLKIKKEKQALDAPSAGCVFKNPENVQFTCGQMIEMLGLKGKRIGGAEVSAKHANFIVNKGGSTCQDVLALIEFIKNKVSENYDIPLELEINVV
ncbi:MAG: UDP-N-acetylmuramate--L-alanine ligase, partial [Candidatus Omnitrophota bacterium]|nr:UDP-N-acetylmuramate--L-alanine ligase [Candidatus Omnitrophota bacterium]